MGQEGTGERSGISHIDNDSIQSTSDAEQSSGIEVQHLSSGGEGGTEGTVRAKLLSIGPSGAREETSSQSITSEGRGWAIIQLTEAAESVLVVDVERDLRRLLGKGSAKLFFPAISRGGAFLKDSPYANYIFMASELPDATILKLEQSRFVDFILCLPGSAGRWRSVSKITDEELHQTYSPKVISQIEPGTEVRVISGDWTGLEGVLLHSFGDQVKVSLQLRSRRRILVLSREEIQIL